MFSFVQKLEMRFDCKLQGFGGFAVLFDHWSGDLGTTFGECHTACVKSIVEGCLVRNAKTDVQRFLLLSGSVSLDALCTIGLLIVDPP